ncbi:DUF4336 domain-containing protein [Mesorhizobium sanjuanii]|uniref:DUF4336 domain-containing protein n=1 Tax=Mesorhizobium sanjuanii TaxID=2037900 RepID=A0A2A6F9E7_9HYPH|nr:DUF4336 domain-containing protein [Mesorhizobium sanjuanii]PDQ18559.1 DUF4336 domain-containing protein [Mesorhizobium sanjuanii]
MSDGHRERSGLEPYEPLNVLKPVGPDIWIVDGPEITLAWIGLKLPFTTRMTVVRLDNGDLILHSPVEYSPELRSTLEALGPIRFLIAPNSLHYWWVPDWKAQLPEAMVLAVPGLEKRAKRPIQVDQPLIDRKSPWPDEIGLLVVSGDVLTEAIFFHRSSQTLILTDLIENFEPGRIHSWFFRLLVRLAGAADPDGKAPIDMQLSFFRSSQALRKAVRQMIVWAPERIIIAHGRWYQQNGVKELKRAFRWV